MFSIQILASEFYFTKASINGISRAYGFILGQDMTLDKINKEYPELTTSVIVAKAEFNAAFPEIKTKLYDQLVSVIGENEFKKLDND